MNSPALVVMGVCGCGKSTIASLLADQLGGIYFDADDYHPVSNKEKMAAGIPLTDEDRWPWLAALNALIQEEHRPDRPCVLACSALREVYRTRLAEGLEGLRFVYLKGSREEIRARLESRAGHFMPPGLLDSQLTTLEEPTAAITVSILPRPDEIVANVLTALRAGV